MNKKREYDVFTIHARVLQICTEDPETEEELWVDQDCGMEILLESVYAEDKTEAVSLVAKHKGIHPDMLYAEERNVVSHWNVKAEEGKKTHPAKISACSISDDHFHGIEVLLPNGIVTTIGYDEKEGYVISAYDPETQEKIKAEELFDER